LWQCAQPDALVDHDRLVARDGEADVAQLLGLHFERFLALRADRAHEPHRHHALQRRGDHERLQADVDQAGDRRRRVVGVHGRQHHVAGDRGAERDLRGLGVADLADHDDVRILAQDRAQRAGERLLRLLVDVHLVDAGELVLDRVLDRHQVLGLVLDVLAGTSRAWSTCPSRSAR
jgi:hypothetical protein